jgi:branched-chain amino acid transport system permease protein
MDRTQSGAAEQSALSRVRTTVTDEPVGAFMGVLAVLLALDLIWGLVEGRYGFASVGALVWDGLMRGLVIGLAGVGLSMTYSILGFANFAHGDYVTTGAFAGWGVAYIVAGRAVDGYGEAFKAADLFLVGAGGGIYGSNLGIAVTNTPLAIVAGVVVAGVFAVGLSLGIDRLVFKPLREQSGIILLIASVGVAFALRYLIVFVYTTTKRGTTAIGEIWTYQVPVGSGTINVSAHDLTVLAVSGGLMLGVHLLLQQSKLGKAMRAMADNEDLARITGIPTEKVVTWTWIIGGGLAGVAGFVLVLWTGTMSFQFGWLLLLLIFAAVILGGIGSIYGAIFGGIIIGLAMSLSVLWIPSDFARATAFAVMILILLYRPQGLFAGRMTA